MYHYTYLIKSKVNKMKYIGVRTSEVKPENDNYWGSSKYIPSDVTTTHKKRILQVFNDRKKAVEHEIYLHHKYNVAVNPLFYNRAKQTSTSYDTTGVSNPCSKETRKKISCALKGKKRTPAMVEAMRKRMLGTVQSQKTCEKRGNTIRKNGSNKGIKNASFRPWYISTENTTYLFITISKNEQSLKDGHYSKYYADLQKKFNKIGQVVTRQFGKIFDMGFIPT